MGRSIARPLSLAASILLALLWSGDAILTVSVVTGANKGIGLATAKKLAQTPGHLCILTSREPAKGAQALKEMQQEGMDAVCKQLDISDGSSVERFVSEMEAEYGRCDVLVNNAGIAFKNSDPTPFRDQARPTLMTNFFNTVDFTEAMLPLVRKSNLGRIVNVASGSGRLSILKSEALREQFTDPTLTLAKLKALMNRFIDDVEAGRHDSEGWPSSCYGMSKLGLIAYTKVAARIEEEFGSGVIVNACSPGYTATDMTSHMGEQTPEEGARMPYMLTQMGSSGEARLTGAFYRLGELTEW